MRKTLMLMILASGLVLSGCTDKEKEASSSGKVIEVGTDAAFAPMEFLKGDEVVGFDADLLKEVMKEAKLKYNLENKGWEPLFLMLENNEIQLGVSSITITPKRLESYDFTNPYFESVQLIMFKEGTNITGAKDLLNLKKIGVQIGTTGEVATEKVVGAKSEKIKKYETTALAIMGLKNGDVEAVVTDNIVANEYIKNNPKDKIKTVADESQFESEYYGYMVKKGNSDLQEKLNKALENVIANGKYTEIYKKWFGVEPKLDKLISEK